MATTPQPASRPTGLRRGLSLRQAVGISVALMAPSMAAHINAQGTAGLVGRATPLAFFLAVTMLASPGPARRLSAALTRADDNTLGG